MMKVLQVAFSVLGLLLNAAPSTPSNIHALYILTNNLGLRVLVFRATFGMPSIPGALDL